jgi:hypothetical protein
MKDEDVGEAKVGAERAEEPLQRFDATGRRADAAHRNRGGVMT